MSDFESLKNLDIEKRERTVFDHFIVIDGVRFDADDLLTTLYEVEGGGVYTTFSDEKFKILKSYGILESQGSNRWMSSAELGPNGEAFTEMLAKKVDETNG